MRVLGTVDDDGDGRRAVNDQSDKQKVEIIGRVECPGDGQVFGGTLPDEGQTAARRALQRRVRVLAAVTEVDDELVDAVQDVDVPIATGTDARYRHWRTRTDT